jgi:Flp pilus assembly protein TadD
LVGTLYAAIGKPEEAREHLERVVEKRPKHAEAHYALAVVLRDGENDLVGADRHFREYLKLQPDGPHADEARDSLLKDVP